jgi:hypothetical protein
MSGTSSFGVAVVPESSTFILIGLSMIGMGLAARLRFTKSI